MAERETSSGLFTDLANSMIGNIREIAARTIDANVNFAKQILDFQAQTTNGQKYAHGSNVPISTCTG